MGIAIATGLSPILPLNIYEKNQTQTQKKKRNRALPRIFISTNPSHINLLQLTNLFTSSNLSCHRFPNFDSQGRVEPVNPDKLCIALSHSLVVVSAFCKPEFLKDDESNIKKSEFRFGELFERAIPVTELSGQLVGFGRAISDNGLTASIHDVMVLPSLQGLGIGRMIVKRIIRVLTSRDIYDISALCSEKERFFFEACGFGDDMLGSTTMMYTREPLGHYMKGDQMVKHAGRMLLLVPPLRESFSFKRITSD